MREESAQADVWTNGEIINRLSKITTLSNEEPEYVTKIEDNDTLKKQSSFYENAKNGNYIILYSNLAIIYDLQNNVIIAINKK